MSRSLLVTLLNNKSDAYIVHRFQNFGEDVFRHVRSEGWGQVDLCEVDRATSSFAITDVKSPKVRRVIAWVEKEAERHGLVIEVAEN